ncbi:MAG: Rrf2 family transcriptional regulator [Acidiferrobacterales bacterium]|jgi:Rrf2 family iron-sulfur cluster assembly transcriptional regulator|nr:Rrf2 family transcriptional regulator [Acidiferrobacterales bacterium]
MKISRKARFAVSAMIRLALRGENGTKTLSDLSADQGISLSYLEQLFAQLRREGIVVGVRGPGGGYRLAKDIEDIDVASIMTAVDDQAYTPPAANTGDTDEQRPTDSMWDSLSTQLHDYLGTITLGDVLRGNDVEEEEPRKVA